MQTRILYEKDHYILEAIFRTPKFTNALNNLNIKCAKLGFPIPDNGFLTVKNYHAWINNLHEKNFIYESYLEDILESFGLDPKNEKYLLGLRWRIIFGIQKDVPITPTLAGIKYDYDKEDKQLLKVWVGLLPHTIKEDYIAFWDRFRRIKPYMVGGKKRNKEMKKFDRNLKIYMLYLEISQNVQKDKLDKKAIIGAKERAPKSSITRMQAYPAYEKICMDYQCESLTYTDLHKIIGKYQKMLGHLKLL